MNPVTAEQFDLLTRAELRALLQALVPELEALCQRVAQLEAENERLQQQLDKATNSRNSSQPPARDQKVNPAPGKTTKKPGPPFGHQKFARPWVDNPDQVLPVPVTSE